MNLPPDDDLTVLSTGNASGAQPVSPAHEGGHVLPVGTRLDEFELTAVLGEGGFGVVYLAYDHLLERQVALKEYMPSFARRGTGIHVGVHSAQNADSFEAGRRSFVNEARLLAKFDHPSLVKVYRFWEGNGTAYMVMPYYRGQTLKQVLQSRPERPDEAWLKTLLAPLLDALETIHQDHCFHRDIAPDNILMLEDGRPVLLDFGAARRAVGAANQAFTVILKQNYAPIEQYAEMPGMSQGAWTDLYALASVMHYAIEGTPPPPAMSRMMSDPYVPLATRHAGKFSLGFLQALDQALAFKPGDRPQSVAAMRTLLDIDAPAPAAAAVPAAAGPAPPAPPAAGKPRRLVWVLGGLGAAGAAAALLFGAGRDAPAPANHGAASAKPAVPAPAAPTAPAADAPFDPVAALDAVLAGADPERQVTVRVKNHRVRIGEDIRFAITASHAGYVYVEMVSSNRTDFNMVFPNALDRDNRIRAGQTLDLPRRTWPIGAAGPAGTDHFVVIVSDTPRDFRGAGLVKGEPFGMFPVAQAAQLQRGYRGATALFAGVPSCEDAPCPGTYGAASFVIDEAAP
ncbi:serine/threonine-protein kinase [Herbaspirillum sp. SJZ107]|uniref:serine/threonine protein kinase n=1 Tax=Herbaspirillum sp. SJZ107 TaxID=2572881 RepID=UPI001152A399|nr:serine/threonine-protein kinase [Herbaspirillum sp. SJZ107]TQK08252.1 hypothetical protein FBX97_3568 [Herbaspirillum sp. SJZ107]